jgi:anti-sigma B factor antagonist
VTKRIRDLLVVTRLLTVFDTYDSEAEALASFGAASAQ